MYFTVLLFGVYSFDCLCIFTYVYTGDILDDFSIIFVFTLFRIAVNHEILPFGGTTLHLGVVEARRSGLDCYCLDKHSYLHDNNWPPFSFGPVQLSGCYILYHHQLAGLHDHNLEHFLYYPANWFKQRDCLHEHQFCRIDCSNIKHFLWPCANRLKQRNSLYNHQFSWLSRSNIEHFLRSCAYWLKQRDCLYDH